MGAGDKEINYVERSVRDADGTLTTREVQQPSDAAPEGLVGERSYRCVICGFAYKEHNIKIFRGKPYCIPGGCSKDIASILFKENADRVRTKHSGTEEVSHFSEGG